MRRGRRQKKPKVGFNSALTNAMLNDDGGGLSTQRPLHAPPEPNWYQTAKARLGVLAAVPCLLRHGPRVDPASRGFNTGCSSGQLIGLYSPWPPCGSQWRGVGMPFYHRNCDAIRREWCLVIESRKRPRWCLSLLPWAKLLEGVSAGKARNKQSVR